MQRFRALVLLPVFAAGTVIGMATPAFAASPPLVDIVTPNHGSAAGGTAVQIVGSGFSGATQVSFGATTIPPCAPGVFVNCFNNPPGNDIVVFTNSAPGAPNTTVDVNVTVGGTTSSSNSFNKFTYDVAGPPVVSGLSPRSGTANGGTSVQIFGNGFVGATQVAFGAAMVPPCGPGSFGACFGVNGDGEIFATSPPGAGPVDVKVTVGAVTSGTGSADMFTYMAAGPPVVDAVVPGHGSAAGGTNVQILGSGFGAATQLAFGAATQAPCGPAVFGPCFQINGDGRIFANSAPGTAGMTVDVKMTAAGLTSGTNPFAKFTYDAAGSPIVSGVSPRSGAVTGGTNVQILGTGFAGATQVAFGTTILNPCGPGVFGACFNIPPGSDTVINASSPLETVSQVDVRVTTAAGTSPTGTPDQFTYVAAGLAVVDAVVPGHGTAAGGTGVQITGSGFTGATAVQFGTTTSLIPCGPAVFVACFGVNGDNAINAASPSGTVGPVDVKVTTGAGTSAINLFDTFTYDVLGSPAVTGVSPRSGPIAGGTMVLILGSGFTGATAVAFVGSPSLSPCGSPPCFMINNDGAISAPSPAGSAGLIDVTVSARGMTSAVTPADSFTYTSVIPSLPAVDAVIPAHGAAGGAIGVQIYGKGFTGATAVAFGTTTLLPCAPTVFGPCFNPNGDTFISAFSPPGPPSTTVHVTVTAGGSTSVSSFDTFTFDPIGAPMVSGVSPRSGSATGGTGVQIIGSGFAGVSQVAFGTATEPPCGPGVFGPCFNMPMAGGNMIFANTPPGSVGPPVDVTVKVGAVTSATGTADKFGYAAPSAPVVDAVVPGHGTAAGGPNVQIAGSGFSGATSVAFGTATLVPCGPSVFGPCFNVNADSAINTNFPPGTAGMTVVVTVTAAGHSSSINAYDTFKYDPVGLPAVSGLSPRSGSLTGGTGVQILGSGFTGATAVAFGTTSVGPCTPSVFGPCFNVNFDGMINATSPSGAVGPVDLKVTTGLGTSSAGSADTFNYLAASAPLVDVVLPGHGTAAGGTPISIHGSGFSGATAIAFGTTSLVPCSPTVFASCFNINGDNAIVTNTPSGPVGPVDVRVTTGAGTSAINAFDTFIYDPQGPPVVNGVSPRGGPAAGGTGVLILGGGFTGATAVTFGTAALPSCPASGGRCFNLLGDGRITATSPSGIGGMTVDVTVSVGETRSATGIADNFSYAPTPTPLPPPGPGLKQLYHPLSPARILDTRDGTGGVPAAALGPGSTLAVPIAGRGGVPSTGVSAVVLNVTVTSTSASSYLALYASGSARPATSNLNWAAGQTVANLVEVQLGSDGKVTAFNAQGFTHVIIDAAGYVSTPEAGPAGQYNPLVPARLLDTRIGTGGAATLGAGATVSLQVTGRGGVPASGVSAALLNLTATNASTRSYVTVWPDGMAQPLTSNLNFVAGQTVPNRAIVKVGPTGKVDLYNSAGSVDLVVDVGGYFTDATPGGTGSGFNPLTSARLLDTRDGTGGVSTPVGPGGVLAMQVAGLNGVPAATAANPPKAVVLNVTVTNPTSGSYLVLWPDGGARPLASDLNFTARQTVANLVVVAVAADGKFDLFNGAGSADMVIDIVGWYG